MSAKQSNEAARQPGVEVQSLRAQLARTSVECGTLKDNIDNYENSQFREKPPAQEDKKTAKSRNKPKYHHPKQEPIAFHAVCDVQKVEGLCAGQVIRFETPLLNHGDSYSPLDGVFTAPIHGLFHFSVSILSDYPPKNHVEAEVVKNGNCLARIHAYSAERMRDQGSVAVTTELHAQDKVWVRLIYPATAAIFGSRWSSFTGHLIAKL
ncbi:C1QL4-like protein [Mya arenaria]|uniref:C1QL4-like protein n=1 Tax=Mya arenaria TaxID=6604 RepID=A0ABY7DJR1_MYAAR|nr:complement C1q-like protein 4 [Mya arenaria]WAQ97118.1 C1QL4-like protein [Mya arenaria]